MVEPVHRDSRGIVDPGRGLARFSLDRRAPGAELARFVDRVWVPSWDLPEGVEHHQTVLSHPVVNLVAEPDGAVVVGVARRPTTKVLAGRGIAVGLMFRPAAFAPFCDGPVRALTGVTRPVEAVLAPRCGAALARLVAGVAAVVEEEAALPPSPDTVNRLADLAEAVLAPLVPAPRQPCEDLIELVEHVIADRTINRVDAVAGLAGVSARQLQRRFADEVGVSPKWLIRRYRIFDAAEAAARGGDVDWAALAVRLGFADQAHLTRAFTAAIGTPPERYARACTPLPEPLTAR